MANEFLPIGTALSPPNILDNSGWAAATPANGRGTGLMARDWFNKGMRQASVMAAAIGRLVHLKGYSALDDGDVDALRDEIHLAILKIISDSYVAPAVSGAFNPTITFNGTSTGVTYALQDGRYQLIGKIVFVQGLVILSSKGSDVGTARIGAMPFSINGNNPLQALVDDFVGLTHPIQLLSLNGTSTLELRTNSATGDGQVITDTSFANNSRVHFAGFYVQP